MSQEQPFAQASLEHEVHGRADENINQKSSLMAETGYTPEEIERMQPAVKVIEDIAARIPESDINKLGWFKEAA